MELVQSSGGGPWGGGIVDDKFFTLLRELLGSKVLEKLQDVDDCRIIEKDMRMDFESSKRTVGDIKLYFTVITTK